MTNPFSNIVPRKTELLVNKVFLKKVSEKIKERIKDKKLIVIEGDYGSGKTVYLWNLYNKLKTSKEFIKISDNIHNIFSKKTVVRNKTLIIDNFDLTSGLTDKKLFSLSEEFLRLLKGGMIIILSARRKVIRRFLQLNPLLRPLVNKLNIPSLSYESSKELVINRLNEVRPKPLKSLKPFTETELREIWSKSDGNPRQILLLCKYLYERRMLLEA